jgi:hypothetical protein
MTLNHMATKPTPKSNKPAPIPNKPSKGPPKHYQQDGHWIVNPNKTNVLVCTCGNRYLKTRPGQTLCLRCVSMGKSR